MGHIGGGVIVQADDVGAVQQQVAQPGPQPQLLGGLLLPGHVGAAEVQPRFTVRPGLPDRLHGGPQHLAAPGPQPAHLAAGSAAHPGLEQGGHQPLPVRRHHPAKRVCPQALQQLRRRIAQQLRQPSAEIHRLRRPVRLEAEQGEGRRQRAQQGVHLVLGAGKLRLGLLQPGLGPAGQVNVQQHGVKHGGAAAVLQALRPEVHPQGRTLPALEPQVVVHRVALPLGVQQGLQQGRPVLLHHQGGNILGKAVQQLPAAPAGELAQPPVEGQAPQALPAQLQGGHGAGQVIRHEAGGALRFGRNVQHAAHHAVHDLIAGEGEGAAGGGLKGQGGGGAGEGHRVQRRQRRQVPGSVVPEEAAALQLRRRRAQQGGGRVVGEAADQVHHVPAAVGDHLQQQEGDAAALEGLCKLVQRLRHENTPEKKKSLLLYM